MKLITEFTDAGLRCLKEDKEGRKYYIEGIFMQANTKNRNGRVYDKDILARAVEKYNQEQVMTGRAVGELNHPDGPAINLDKVSHRIISLRWDGDSVVGKALVLDTPMGKIVKGLIDGGVKLGVSSRGMGTLEQRGAASYVRDDFLLSTVDIVQDPSAPEAFVNGIMESVEWSLEGGIFKRKLIEKYNETEIQRKRSAALVESQLKSFSALLSKL